MHGEEAKGGHIPNQNGIKWKIKLRIAEIKPGNWTKYSELSSIKWEEDPANGDSKLKNEELEAMIKNDNKK